MNGVILDNKIKDNAWYKEKGIDRIEINEFIYNYQGDDAGLLRVMQKKYSINRQDALDVFTQSVRDQLSSETFVKKLTS